MTKKTSSHNVFLLGTLFVALLLLIMCYSHQYYYHLKSPIFTSTIQQYHDSTKFNPKTWNIIYYQKPRKTGGTAMVHLLHENGLFNSTKRSCYSSSTPEEFVRIKTRCISLKHKVFYNEYWPFHIQSYLKWKEEEWNDVLLITLLRDPIERVISDLLYQGTWECNNINYKHVLMSTESQLIECVHRNHAKFTSNMYSKMFRFG